MQRFEYVCYHNTDDGLQIDEFSLFANVVSKTDETVTYDRYMAFGRIQSQKSVTISCEEFAKYYQPLTDEIYQRCLEQLSLNKENPNENH